MSNIPQEYILPLDAFVRSISVNKSRHHAFFLGAGASVTSKVPSANDCLWQWKRQIVLSQNPSWDRELYDLSIETIRKKIQLVLDTEGRYPSSGSAEEYSIFVEACYPISQDRQKYFQSLSEKSEPSNGYRYLCLLALANIVKSVWTTNFDGLMRRVSARAEGLTTIEIGLDTSQRVIRPINSNELLIVQLHGDYRYDSLKNTQSELQEQDKTLRDEFVRYLRDTNLIVVGYSGRDESIMSELEEAYSQGGQGRLYWCGFDDEEAHPSVISLLEKARDNNRQAFYISTYGFDDLMVRLSTNCLEDTLLKRALELRNKTTSKADLAPSPFQIDKTSKTIAFIRSNALRIECPNQVYQFDVPDLNREGAWRLLRDIINGYPISAGLLRNKVLALGSVDDIKRAFGNRLQSPLLLSPIDDRELSITDGVIVSILLNAIAQAIASSTGLKSAKHNQDIYLLDSKDKEIVKYKNITYQVDEILYLFLRQYKNKTYLVLNPSIRIRDMAGKFLEPELNKVVRNYILSRRFNADVNSRLQKWINMICPTGSSRFGFPDNTSTFQFTLSSETLYSRVRGQRNSYAFNLSKEFENVDYQSGVEYTEPPLIFSNRQGDSLIKDVHPLRGISENRPYDFRRNQDILGGVIEVGVICPKPDNSRLSSFINGLKVRSDKKHNDEYLLDYRGFDLIYELPLDIPQPHNNAWITVSEPHPNSDIKQGASYLVKTIQSAIDSLFSSTSARIAIIYVPERWKRWEKYNIDGENFDLHDWIKAYCVQKGKATQFIRERTIIQNYDPCRVKWWLSLAIYVKSGRTPWILDSTDIQTAFIGIGYTLLPNAPKGSHIVVGCSHIYNSAGLGLGYRLSKIEEPEFDRRNNPYLSQNDARRLGENTKILFNQSGTGIPKRVVIHKRTPFNQQEVKGFIEGLSGIPTIDMLELNHEPALKYINGKDTKDQIFNPDNYPIRRGTCVLIDDKKALLWVHGVIDGLTPRYRFFLGGRGIPSPIVVTRHYGDSPLSLISTEILGLSKMNWNNLIFTVNYQQL